MNSCIIINKCTHKVIVYEVNIDLHWSISALAPGQSSCRKIQKLTLPMLRLFSSKAQGRKVFSKPFKPQPCHDGFHSIALAEYSQMSTHVPGF